MADRPITALTEFEPLGRLLIPAVDPMASTGLKNGSLTLDSVNDFIAPGIGGAAAIAALQEQVAALQQTVAALQVTVATLQGGSCGTGSGGTGSGGTGSGGTATFDNSTFDGPQTFG